MKAPFIRHVISTFGISILQQFVGLARHILIAAYFGLSREFDGYLVVYAIANLVVFNLSGVFDAVAVSRLVQARERHGDAVFWRTSNNMLLLALAGGAMFAAGLIAILYAGLPILAAGFSSEEKRSVLDLSYYFIPWLVVIIPYYALSAHLKALWQFHWVFGTEIMVMIVSIIVLWWWHDTVANLPLAYGAGYFCAFLVLLCRRGISRPDPSAQPVPLFVSMGNQHLANQIGVAAGLVDRYFQSYLAPGGISALGYVGQIVNNLSSLITFREIYVAPLASAIGRSEKLERILKGVVLISIPCAFFLVAFAETIIRVLFQRGNFTPSDTVLVANLLRILAPALVISSLLAPMLRLFQVLDRISYSHILYLVSLVGTATFQYLLVFQLGLDVYGYAFGSVANSAVVTLVVAGLVRRCGIALAWSSVLGVAAFSLLVAGAAIAIALTLASRFDGLLALIVGGGIYSIVVAFGYFTVRKRIRLITG